MERDSSGRFRSQRDQQQSQQRPMSVESCTTTATGAGVTAIIGGAALGAIAMYLMDPNHGAERRAMARNLAERALESTGDVARTAMSNASHFMGDAYHAAKDKIADSASAAYDAMPNGKDVRKAANGVSDAASNAASSASDTAHSWLESARSFLPRSVKLEKHSDYAMNPGAVSATALSTLVVGAGAMWMFDPVRGRARRAWIGQKLTRAVNEVGRFASSTGRHLRNKMKGTYYETRSAAESATQRVASGVRETIGS
jgi:gas vesicle protein